MKRIIAVIVSLMMVFSSGALAERGGMGGDPNGGGRGGIGGPGGMGGGMTQNDEEIQAILDANASKFQQFTFTDEETGISLEYSLFIILTNLIFSYHESVGNEAHKAQDSARSTSRSPFYVEGREKCRERINERMNGAWDRKA